MDWKSAGKFLSMTWTPVAFLALWELLSRAGLLEPLFFPAPSSLAGVIVDMVQSGELPRHLRATLARMSLGFFWGSCSGVLVGVLMGTIPLVRHALDPLVSALWASPKLTLLPMLIISIGIGEAPKIVLIALGCFLVVTQNTLDGARAIDPVYVALARNYGADTKAVWRKVYLPAISPAVFTATRLALGRALTLTVSVELLNSTEGLGFLVFAAWQGFSMERLYITVIITAGLGMLFHGGLRALERQVTPWRQDARS